MLHHQISLSENILSSAKLGLDCTSLCKELYYMRPSVLEKKLDDDDLKKIFWTNIYNAYFLIIARETVAYKSILKEKRIKVAFNRFSLDDIEFGILRMYKYKMGSFYFNDPFYSRVIKRFALEEIDYDVHLALNRNLLNVGIHNFYTVASSKML